FLGAIGSGEGIAAANGLALGGAEVHRAPEAGKGMLDAVLVSVDHPAPEGFIIGGNRLSLAVELPRFSDALQATLGSVALGLVAQGFLTGGSGGSKVALRLVGSRQTQIGGSIAGIKLHNALVQSDGLVRATLRRKLFSFRNQPGQLRYVHQ